MKNEKYSGEMTPEQNNRVEKAKAGQRYEVTFSQNRRFELKIGRRMFVFDTENKTRILTQEEVGHPDFIQQRSYFNVREV